MSSKLEMQESNDRQEVAHMQRFCSGIKAGVDGELLSGCQFSQIGRGDALQQPAGFQRCNDIGRGRRSCRCECSLLAIRQGPLWPSINVLYLSECCYGTLYSSHFWNQSCNVQERKQRFSITLKCSEVCSCDQSQPPASPPRAALPLPPFLRELVKP